MRRIGGSLAASSVRSGSGGLRSARLWPYCQPVTGLYRESAGGVEQAVNTPSPSVDMEVAMTCSRLFLATALALFVFALPVASEPAKEPITEISFERTPCFGTCPVDKLVLRADGTATYTGTRYVERMGEY